MAYKVADPDFFRKPLMDDGNANVGKELNGESALGLQEGMAMEKAQPLRIGRPVDSALLDTAKVLSDSGFPELALEMEKIRESANRDRFTIAVVGEFSRGKSTFINELLGRSFLPVGSLPTTAVMTRIRYHSPEMIVVFDEQNKKIAERELSQDSWDGLVARNFGGEDFRGTVLAGVRAKWLEDTNIEIIDTPGAGDLNEARIKVVSDALLGCDGVIIAVSAPAALSLTEKLFIEERLLARKIPFMLMIVTKLDLVPAEERAGVIRYIRNKLASWKMDIPVYVPYPAERIDASFDDVTGMDKIRQKIAEWTVHPERTETVENWLLEKAGDLLENAVSALTEKKLISEETDKDKREQKLLDKNRKLAQAQLVWGDLRLQMQKKCTECYQIMLSKADEYSDSITERLQYEAGHSNNPKKWWTEDFPYRSKIELTNMAVGIDNVISRKISEDAGWYSTAIEKTFHSYIICQREIISDKDLFGDFSIGRKLKFEDLDKKRNVIRIGSAVLSISGVALFSALGFMPIIATMGIGTGTSVISEHIFRKKIEEQKDAVKKEIARSVPAFIRESFSESEKRIENVYMNIIREAEKSEQRWLDAQKKAMDSLNIPDEGSHALEITDRLSKLQQQNNMINSMLGREG